MTQRQYYHAVGKRKTAIARVKLLENGAGDISVNNGNMENCFFGVQKEKIRSPLALTNHLQTFDVAAQVCGGGRESQAEAVRHGIARALILFDPTLRSVLKKAGYVRRDSRIRERKKPGLKRARRAPQWQKR